MSQQFLKSLPTHANRFRMHLMTAYLFTLDRLKSAGTDMQRQLLTIYFAGIKVGKHPFSKVKSSCWRCHTTLDFRVYRLICSLVTFLCLTIEIWRNRQFSYSIDNLSKGNGIVCPSKTYVLSIKRGAFCHKNGHFFPINLNFSFQFTALPLL